MAITLEDIQNRSRSGDYGGAQEMLKAFLSGLFPLAIAKVEIRPDTLSLNSVNGFIHLSSPDIKTGANTLFFKFHHEENEEGLKEYYNSQLLSENGFPVEMPVYASHEVGKQVLLYPFKTAERMADVCKRLDVPDRPDAMMNELLGAQQKLDVLTCERYLATLHKAPNEKLLDEPILQLFHHRLVDEKNKTDVLGGRYKQFYAQKVFEFPERSIVVYDDLAKLHWRVNGVEYKGTLAEAFATALKVISPVAHGALYPAVVAHGDAHNGNVWFNAGSPPALSLFDPAFAGPHIPALLAEIKPTFHNIFAHPLWLYDSQEADAAFDIKFDIKGNFIEVEHDWQLSPLRQRFLEIKRDSLWKPLIAELRRQRLLPEQWLAYMRSALFCCPTLVMNLRAHAGHARNFHTPKTSLLGLSIAIMLASPPVLGQDMASEFFKELE